MDLFFLKALLRGKLQTTAKFEEELTQIPLRAKRFRQIENSAEWKEYLQLDKLVNAADFQTMKRERQGMKYKKTVEYRQLEEFKKICKNKFVRHFLRDGSDEASMPVQKYLQLKATVESEEFQKKNDFWKDSHRWEHSDEGKQEARYLALKASDDVVFYQTANVQEIERWEQYEMAFQDEFDWVGMRNSDWKPGFIYPSDSFKNVHSYANEKQAYTGGKNVQTGGSILTIHTKQMPIEGAAWDAKKGMYMKQFSYASDAIYTDKVAIEEGSVIQVKCRCRGRLNHGIYLRSKNHVPFISLFDFTGQKLYCGVKESLKHDNNLQLLNGLLPIPYTIFTVSWQKNEIVWLVNNLEVYRTKNVIPQGEKLYLHMYSFIFEKDRHSTEGELNVDWIRVYNLKK